MAALPYMPLYPADYLADAHHLSTVEHGAYFLLIMAYWMRAAPLPDDDRKLAKMAKLPASEWSEIREELSEFFAIEDGVWRHKRIDADLEKVTEKVRKAKEAAEASARARESKRQANAQRTSSERSANAQTDVEPIKVKAKVKSPVGEVIGAKRASQLSESFEPVLTDKAQRNLDRLGGNLEQELEKFRDYHLSKGTKMKDWQAAFRTWLSNGVKFQTQGGARNGNSGWMRDD